MSLVGFRSFMILHNSPRICPKLHYKFATTPYYVHSILSIIVTHWCISCDRISMNEINTVVRKLRGTIVNIILPPRVLFYCREIYFTAATFILLPRVLFYCREIYFTAASFILAPRVLFYCREFYYTAASFILLPRVLFSPPLVLFSPLAVNMVK